MADSFTGPTPKERPHWEEKIRCKRRRFTMDGATRVETDLNPLHIIHMVETDEKGFENDLYYCDIMMTSGGLPILPYWALDLLSHVCEEREHMLYPVAKGDEPHRVTRMRIPENNMLGIFGMFDVYSSPRLLEELKNTSAPLGFEVKGDKGVSHAVIYINKPNHLEGLMDSKGLAYLDLLTELPPEEAILQYEGEDYCLAVLRPSGLKRFQQAIEDKNMEDGLLGEEKLKLVMRPAVRSCCTVSFDRTPSAAR